MTKEIEEVDEEVEETPDIQAKDKDVELSTFNMYRNAFIREQLKELNVKEGAEMESAIKFVDERADATDSNLSDVMNELKIRMRLDSRKTYADPSIGNGPGGRPRATDGSEVAAGMYQRVKHRLNKTIY